LRISSTYTRYTLAAATTTPMARITSVQPVLKWPLWSL